MLHLRPDLVRMDQAIDFRSAWLAREGAMSILTPEGGVGFGWETQDLHPLVRARRRQCRHRCHGCRDTGAPSRSA